MLVTPRKGKSASFICHSVFLHWNYMQLYGLGHTDAWWNLEITNV